MLLRMLLIALCCLMQAAHPDNCRFVNDLLKLDNLPAELRDVVYQAREVVTDTVETCRYSEACHTTPHTVHVGDTTIQFKVSDTLPVIAVTGANKLYKVYIPYRYLQSGEASTIEHSARENENVDESVAPADVMKTVEEANEKTTESGSGHLQVPEKRTFTLDEIVGEFRDFYVEIKKNNPTNSGWAGSAPKFHINREGMKKRFEYMIRTVLGLRNVDAARIVNAMYEGTGFVVNQEQVKESINKSGTSASAMGIVRGLTEWIRKTPSIVLERKGDGMYNSSSHSFESVRRKIWDELVDKGLLAGTFVHRYEISDIFDSVASHRGFDAAQMLELRIAIGLENTYIINRGSRSERVMQAIKYLNEDILSAIGSKRLVEGRLRLVRNLLAKRSTELSGLVNLSDLKTDTLEECYLSLNRIYDVIFFHGETGEKGKFWIEIFRRSGVNIEDDHANPLGMSALTEARLEQKVFEVLLDKIDERLAKLPKSHVSTTPAPPMSESAALTKLRASGVLDKLIDSDEAAVLEVVERMTTDRDEVTVHELLTALVLYSGRTWQSVAQQTGINPRSQAIPSAQQIDRLIQLIEAPQ